MGWLLPQFSASWSQIHPDTGVHLCGARAFLRAMEGPDDFSFPLYRKRVTHTTQNQDVPDVKSSPTHPSHKWGLLSGEDPPLGAP